MTTLTEYDRVITVNGAEGGKIVGIAMAIGEYAEEGLDGELITVYMLEHNFPEEACKDFTYFMTNYWFNMTDGTFVKVESAQPNEYAVYDAEKKSWSWDAALVLVDIRRERDSKLKLSDWTQLGDTTLTDSQKTEASEYRTKLRDVTKDLDNPVNTAAVSWPTVPDFLK